MEIKQGETWNKEVKNGGETWNKEVKHGTRR